MIEEVLIRRFEKAILFTRPRRFGKTLTMTMFRDFLDIRQDSREIFSGLKIMEHPDVVKNDMNQVPVVYISLKEVYGHDFDEVFQSFRIVMSKLYESNAFLLDSRKVSDVSKAFFDTIWKRNGNKAYTEQALDLISSMLRQHFEKPVFLIIDE